MSFALSSIVRTRQKSFFFLFILILLLCPLLTPSGLVLDSPHLSSASPNVVGSAASQEDNIDSFNVHPVNRWDITNDDFTSTVQESQLNITDIGDGTSDSYILTRGLRDLDGSIEVMYKIDSQDSDYTADFLNLIITESSDLNKFIGLFIQADSTGYLSTTIHYRDADGSTYRTKSLSGNERVFDDIWYKLRIDYDLLESSLRLRNFFDNGIKVFDYFDSDLSHRPYIFEVQELTLRIHVNSQENGKQSYIWFDYINAPFKEREWTNQRTTADPDWIDSSVFGNKIEDDINDFEIWTLVVPRLDAVTGSMFILTNPILNPGDVNDIIFNQFSIYAVDADDGDLHQLLAIFIQIRSVGGGGAAGTISINEALAGIITIKTVIPFITTTQVDLNFQCSLMNDRSNLIWSIAGYFNDDSTDHPFLASGEVDVSDASVDASQEFVLETKYSMTFVDPVEVYAGYKSFSVIERDIFSDLGHLINDVIGDVQQGGNDLFSAIFRWLAGVLIAAWELLIGSLQEVLEVGLGLITSALEVITTAIGDIADDIWTSIGDALDFITEAIAAVIDNFVDEMNNLLNAVITQLAILASDAADLIFDIIDFLIVLVLDIVAEIWAVIEQTVFFIWDAVGLPDILEIFNLTLAYMIEFVQWLVVAIQDVIQLAADLSWIILVVWWIWALPVQWARAAGNPLAGLGNFIEVFFYDLVPWTILGFHVYVPQGIVATLWMILLLPETFVLFTALGI